MKPQIVHSKYFAKVVLEIKFWENGTRLPLEINNKKGPVRKNFPYRGRNISLALFDVNNTPTWLLFLDAKLDVKWLLQEYISDLSRKGLDLPNGGLVFLDEESEELISTNWDIGETEEWANILHQLKTVGAITHTFSATDAALELKIVTNGISLQNLNWEAIPNRLVTSREISPLHLFTKQPKFEDEIGECINKLKAIFDEAKNIDKGIRNSILSYFSVQHRRHNVLGV